MPSATRSPESRRRFCSATSSSYPAATFDRVERLLVLGVVVLGAGQRRHRVLLGLQVVHPPDLERVDADLVGGHVDDALEQLRRLGAPGPAVGADRRRVGDDGLPRELDGRDVVDALGEQLGEAGEDRPDGRVGPAVADHRRAQPDDLAVALDAELHPLDLGAPVDHREHVLGAGLVPAHRTTEHQRGLRRDRVLGVGGGLRAEPAADPRGHDPDHVGVEPEVAGDRVAGAVRGLGGEPEGQAALGGAGLDDAGVGLHRDAREASG